jgi:hypothetical protein
MHTAMLFMAMARAATGSGRHQMLERIARQVDCYGYMTSAQLALCISTISPSSC